MSDRTKAVSDWLKTYPDFDGYLRLNAVPLHDGNSSMNTVSNESVVSEFIDGTKVKHYTFAVTMVCSWSDGFDKVNHDALEWGTDWLRWVDKQFKAGNVPDFGENCEVRKIESLQNIPDAAAIYQEEQLARYMFQARIEFWEKE